MKAFFPFFVVLVILFLWLIIYVLSFYSGRVPQIMLNIKKIFLLVFDIKTNALNF